MMISITFDAPDSIISQIWDMLKILRNLLYTVSKSARRGGSLLSQNVWGFRPQIRHFLLAMISLELNQVATRDNSTPQLHWRTKFNLEVSIILLNVCFFRLVDRQRVSMQFLIAKDASRHRFSTLMDLFEDIWWSIATQMHHTVGKHAIPENHWFLWVSCNDCNWSRIALQLIQNPIATDPALEIQILIGSPASTTCLRAIILQYLRSRPFNAFIWHQNRWKVGNSDPLSGSVAMDFWISCNDCNWPRDFR